MDIFQVILLGLIQGITEWLPISSKTIVAFTYSAFGDEGSIIPVLLYTHFGTALAAIVYYRARLFVLLREALSIRNMHQLKESPISFYISALIGTAIVGLPLLFIQKLLFESVNISIVFALMGAGLLFTSFLLRSQKNKHHIRKVESATPKDGFLTGLVQGFSVLAGLSRSGTTTTALIWQRFSPEATFELSFILSIPTVLAAELLFYFADPNFSSFPLIDGLLLLLASFAFGYLTIETLINFAKRVNLSVLAALFGILMIITGVFGVS